MLRRRYEELKAAAAGAAPPSGEASVAGSGAPAPPAAPPAHTAAAAPSSAGDAAVRLLPAAPLHCCCCAAAAQPLLRSQRARQPHTQAPAPLSAMAYVCGAGGLQVPCPIATHPHPRPPTARAPTRPGQALSSSGRRLRGGAPCTRPAARRVAGAQEEARRAWNAAEQAVDDLRCLLHDPLPGALTAAFQ